MLDLRSVTKSVLREVETLSGKPVEFVADDELPVMATMQIARRGAPCHLLRYRPGGGPLDYLVVHQAGYVLRLFANEPSQRFDFSAEPKASLGVEAMIAAGREPDDDDRSLLPGFAAAVSRWALMTLRSMPVSMRVDAWIATGMPELAAMQREGIARQLQENLDVLGQRVGRLAVPPQLLALNAAYALFADRLAGSSTAAIPYEAAGLLEGGARLLDVWDDTPADPAHDRELVDRWAQAIGIGAGEGGWYRWAPFVP
jgi:hypothetical protein